MVKKRKLRKNKKKSFLWSRVFLAAAIVLGILLAMFLVYEFVDFDKINLFEKSTEIRVDIKDECSPIKNYGMIHQIRDEADCSNNCVSACMIRDMEKVSSEFTFSNSSCHGCVCYCKN